MLMENLWASAMAKCRCISLPEKLSVSDGQSQTIGILHYYEEFLCSHQGACRGRANQKEAVI